MDGHKPDPAQARLVTARWEQFEGELRANVLRIAAIGVLYLIHLGSYLSSQGRLPDWEVLQLAPPGTVAEDFHVMVTLLALAWGITGAAIHIGLANCWFPSWISLASTTMDVVLLTSLICIGSGPQSPLVAGYFLVIAMASLRISLPLIRLTTVGVLAGYLWVLGFAKWPDLFGQQARQLTAVPRYHQLIVMASLALTGVVLGQTIRRFHRIASTPSLAADNAEKGHP